MHSAICSFCCIRFSNGVNRFCARSKNNVSLLKHLCLLFCRTFCLTGAWQPYHTTSRNNGQLNTLQNTEQWFWWKIASHRSSIERVTLFGKPQRTLGCASLRMFEPRLSLGANLSCSAFRVRVRLGSKQYKRTKKKKMHKHALPRNRPFGGGKLPRSKRHGNSESKADPSKKGEEEQWNRNRRLNYIA